MYTQYYGLSENPFSMTPDPRFLYFTEAHREALAALVYGIKERKGFVALTGEAGTGKTTLLYRLVDNLNEKVHTAFIFHTFTTYRELLATQNTGARNPARRDPQMRRVMEPMSARFRN